MHCIQLHPVYEQRKSHVLLVPRSEFLKRYKSFIKRTGFAKWKPVLRKINRRMVSVVLGPLVQEYYQVVHIPLGVMQTSL